MQYPDPSVCDAMRTWAEKTSTVHGGGQSQRQCKRELELGFVWITVSKVPNVIVCTHTRNRHSLRAMSS